jgi:molybdate transport system substrate-binding protein
MTELSPSPPSTFREPTKKSNPAFHFARRAILFDTSLNPNTLASTMTARFLVIVLLALLQAATIRAAEIMVFAAASLTDALQSIAGDYEKETGHKVIFNFAASSTLARQIQEGARADLFFSADEEKMDQLQKRGLIRIETRRTLLSNRLVVVVGKKSSFIASNFQDLTKAKRVAIAEPNTVPAGIYARRYLEKVGVWKQLSILPTENVRGALSAVESGNADAAVVYKTDAAISQKVKIAHEVPDDPEIKIGYPIALLKDGKQPQAAEHFLAYLHSPKAAEVFKRYGFIVRGSENGRD